MTASKFPLGTSGGLLLQVSQSAVPVGGQSDQFPAPPLQVETVCACAEIPIQANNRATATQTGTEFRIRDPRARGELSMANPLYLHMRKMRTFLAQVRRAYAHLFWACPIWWKNLPPVLHCWGERV